MTRTSRIDDRRVGRWIFDAGVVAAVLSAVLHLLTGQWEAGLRFGLLALIIGIARWGDVPPPFAAAFAVLALLATWASVHHWYRQIAPADEIVHLLTPASLAAVLYFLLVRARVMPDAQVSRRELRSWTPVLWVTLAGVAAAVLWEFYEWGVEQVAPSSVIVGYTDTVVDLAAGAVGSVVAGRLVLAWARRHPGHR